MIFYSDDKNMLKHICYKYNINIINKYNYIIDRTGYIDLMKLNYNQIKNLINDIVISTIPLLKKE